MIFRCQQMHEAFYYVNSVSATTKVGGRMCSITTAEGDTTIANGMTRFTAKGSTGRRPIIN